MTVAELTTDAIDAMPAGRDMDALVHQDVFGLRVEWHDDEPYIPNRDELLFGVQPIPEYSLVIAAAWEVVEKVFRPRGYYIAPEHARKGWGVYEGDDWREVAIGDTAPLAICRAALKGDRVNQ